MDDEVRESVRELHDHLRATEERPLRETANRWLGEAQAVAADAARAAEDGDDEAAVAVIEKRVGQVARLLSHVEETGDELADEHVAAARERADEVLAALDAAGSTT